jgi:RND superfamily putative drug exporter
VQEEQKAHGKVQGIIAALTKTGRIISTCGFIMAGTFASLFAGSFSAMKELGFALAVGVLLDTLVVRPILVPTFLILWEGRRWAPVDKLPETIGAGQRQN